MGCYEITLSQSDTVYLCFSNLSLNFWMSNDVYLIYILPLIILVIHTICYSVFLFIHFWHKFQYPNCKFSELCCVCENSFCDKVKSFCKQEFVENETKFEILVLVFHKNEAKEKNNSFLLLWKIFELIWTLETSIHLNEVLRRSVRNSLKDIQYLFLWWDAKSGKQKLKGLHFALMLSVGSAERWVGLCSGCILNYNNSAHPGFDRGSHWLKSVVFSSCFWSSLWWFSPCLCLLSLRDRQLLS